MFTRSSLRAMLLPALGLTAGAGGAEQEKLGRRQQEAASGAALEKLRGIRDRALAAGLAIRQ